MIYFFACLFMGRVHVHMYPWKADEDMAFLGARAPRGWDLNVVGSVLYQVCLMIGSSLQILL